MLNRSADVVNNKKHIIKTVAYAFFAAVAFLLPFVIAGGGALFLRDDFNYQQIVFNIANSGFAKTGNLGWSWCTDLGSSVIGSYSFYNLFSPFSLLTFFLPAKAIPYATAPILAIKYAVAAVTAFLYIRRFVKNPDTAVFGAVLYAFSGFQTTNLLFPFHDVTALFPLLLLAFEKTLENPKKNFGLFALASALCCFVNYYFFFGQIIFLIIYFICRVAVFGKFESKLRSVLRLMLRFIAEGALGLGIAGIAIIPAALSVLQNPRLGSSISEVVFHWTRYFTLAQSALLPADVMGSQAYFLEKACTSCSACLPFISLAFVFAYIIKNPKKPFAILIAVLAVVAAVPVLNSAFSMFNAHYYARWFYMATLIFALVSAIAADEAFSSSDTAQSNSILNRRILIKGTCLNTLLTVMLVASEILLIIFFKLKNHPYYEKINISTTAIYAIFALSCAVLLIFVLKIKKPQTALKTLTVSVLVVSVITSSAALYRYKIGGTSVNTGSQTNLDEPLSEERTLEIITDITAEKLSLSEEQNYRIRTAWYDRGLNYTVHSYDNLSMTLGVPSVNSFISTVSGGIFDFYTGLGIDRNVTTLENDDPALSALLSCKYYLTSDNSKELSDGKSPVGSYVHSDGTIIYVFEYDNFLPIGFSYDFYMTKSELLALPEENRAYAQLCAAVVEDDAIVENSNSISSYMKAFASTDEYKDLLSGKKVTENDVSLAVAMRSTEASKAFTRDSNGFTSEITVTEKKLAYFSVPHDSGWSAEINGKPVNIISSNGMMAVMLEEGVNNIVFSYETPGLKLGTTLTVLCFATAILWFVYGKKRFR